MELRVLPATTDRWPDVERVFGPRATSCWCQRFLRHEEEDDRAALRREVEQADVPVGLLAYRGGEPVGWTRVVPRSTLPGITANRALARVLPEDADAWWVSCLLVVREHRGAGVALALLEAAVGWAAEHGAGVLEGHPVDVGGLSGTPSASAVFTGTLSTFQRAGFVEVGRTYRTRPVVRHQLGRPPGVRRPGG